MATPPEQPSRPSYGYHPGTTLDFARLPIPGNAEFVVYVIVLIVFALGIALGQALHDNPEPGETTTFERTLSIPTGGNPGSTVTP